MEPRGGSVNPETTSRRKRPRVPDAQRKRVKLACERCRKNKLRCDGSQPCSRCAHMGRQCAYKAPEPVKTNDGHVSPSSMADQQNEQLQILRQIFAELHPDIPADLEGLRRCRSDLQTGTPKDWYLRDSQKDRWDVSASSEADHRPIRGEEAPIYSKAPDPIASVTVVSQGKTHFEGYSSLWSFFDSVRKAVTNDDLRSNESSEEADCSGTTIHRTSLIGFGVDWKTAVLGALPPRGIVDFLTTTFFRFAQNNYFCIHPEIFSRKLAAFYDGTHEFQREFQGAVTLSSRKSAEFISVLFMVLAIGSQFAEVGESEKGHLEGVPVYQYSPNKLLQIEVPVPTQNPGWRFYEVSRKLLPDIICSSTMASVQACILQGIFLPSTTSRDAGYNVLGLALRMAINMGLHRMFRGNSLHAHVRELRNRLWWTVYVAERLYSIEMGRPLCIADSEIDTPLPVDIPEWDQCTVTPTRIGGLVAMVKLCRLMGIIVESIYCRPSSETGTIIRPKLIRQLKHDLEKWRRELPAHMRLENRETRAVAHISLMYEQANILLTRSCLHCAVVCSQTESVVRGEADQFLRQQAQDCVDSAVASIKIVATLKLNSLLCHFSFHDALYCSSSLYVLLLATRKLEGVVAAPREHIYQGISLLLELAKGSEAAASALAYIIPAVISYDCAGASEAAAADTSSLGDKGRNEWKAWLTGQADSQVANDRVADYMNRGVPSTFSDRLVLKSRLDMRDGVIPQAARQGRLHLSAQHHLMNHRTDVAAPFLDPPTTEGVDHERAVSPEVLDVMPFWVPDHPELDILGRDFGVASRFERLS
ncbi:fungal-specific transcription factor domain-containing protein [Xylariaceae sp. FL0016]|nr:fungal-specific transcription factor domain-containing protein [Xylariaceae sp. FL0016]